MSLSALSTGTSTIVLDTLIKTDRAGGLYLATEPVDTGNITGGGFSSGTYTVYALAVNINPGGAKLYIFEVRNLTGPANATSSNIPLSYRLKPITGGGAAIRRNGYQAFIQLPTNSTNFNVRTGGSAVSNYSFVELVIAP